MFVPQITLPDEAASGDRMFSLAYYAILAVPVPIANFTILHFDALSSAKNVLMKVQIWPMAPMERFSVMSA